MSPRSAPHRRGRGKREITIEFSQPLVPARDPKVQAISEVVNAFYAEKTREVLQKMQDVLSKIET